MCATVTGLLTTSTFLSRFETSLAQWDVGFFPNAIEGLSDPCAAPYIEWAHDLKLLESCPRQTLLYVPMLQRDDVVLSGKISRIRTFLYSDSKGGSEIFAAAYRTLQDVMDKAPVLLRAMQEPTFQVSELAQTALNRNKMEDILHSAVLLLYLGDQDSIIHAADQFMESARLYAGRYGADADALLSEIAYATEDGLYCRLDRLDDPHGTHRAELITRRDRAIRAALKALPPEPDPVYDVVRVFAGLRACFGFDVSYERMIPFLVRYGKLFPMEQQPDRASENLLRMAWAVLKDARVSYREDTAAVWEFVARQIRTAVSGWKDVDGRAGHIARLEWFLKGAEQIAEQKPK